MECKATWTNFGSLGFLVLISTYWNVKTIIAHGAVKRRDSFNLNLLECKVDKRQFFFFANFRVLISTYWNVKAGETAGFFICDNSFNLNLLECKGVLYLCYLHIKIKVLISTYWNVKCLNSLCFITVSGVLISTYWNVKTLIFWKE